MTKKGQSLGPTAEGHVLMAKVVRWCLAMDRNRWQRDWTLGVQLICDSWLEAWSTKRGYGET